MTVHRFDVEPTDGRAGRLPGRGRVLVGHLRPHAGRRPRPRPRRRRPPARPCAAPPSARSRSPRPARWPTCWCRRSTEALRDYPSVVVPAEVAVAVGFGKVLDRERCSGVDDRRRARGPCSTRPDDAAGRLRGRTRATTVEAAARRAMAPPTPGGREPCATALSSLHRHAGAPRRRRPAARAAGGHRRHHRRVRRRAPRAPRGHRARCASSRPSGACRRAVVTFDRHPASVVRPESAPLLLTDLDQKLELLAATGRRLHARRPLRRGPVARSRPRTSSPRCWSDCLGARAVVVGEDFHFGHQPPGQRRAAPGDGRRARLRGARASSWSASTARRRPSAETRCRRPPSARALAAGDLDAANAMLGRPHEVRGVVGHGDERARELGFPTANVAVPGRHLPAGRRHLRRLVPATRRRGAPGRASRSAGGRRSTSEPTPRCSRPTCSTSTATSTTSRPGCASSTACATS